MKTSIKIMALLTGFALAGPATAATEIHFSGLQTNAPYLLSSVAGGIPFQVEATFSSGTILSMSVMVTNLLDRSLVTTFSDIPSVPSSTVSFTHTLDAEVGVLQLTAVARLGSISELRSVAAITVTNVGTREKRFNEFTYKASHNSYARSETIADQIDNYNVWMFELDCFWDDNYQGEGNNVIVSHFCGDTTPYRPIDVYFHNLNLAETAEDRVTAIYLQFSSPDSWAHDVCGFDDWPEEATYLAFLKGMMTNTISPSWIYPASEFSERDSKCWPSMQELVRRGYHYIVILNTTVIGRTSDTLFFGETNLDYDPFANDVLTNHDGGCDSNPSDSYPTHPNDPRWLSRVYPGGLCSEECDYHDGNYYETALSRGFNFLASNCVNRDHTFNTGTHSPQPTFVSSDSTTGNLWGTHDSPFTDLPSAIMRASPKITIKIGSNPSPYYLTAGSSVISKPLLLKRASNVGANPVIRKFQ